MIKKFFKSSLIKASGIYTITNVINRAIPFLLLPVLTRYLNPNDYGIVAMFGVLLSFVSPFTGLCIHGAIARQYYEKDNVHLPTYIGNCFFLLAVSSTLTALIFFVFSGYISQYTAFPKDWMWVVIAVSIASFVNQVVITLWQVQTRPVPIGIFQITQTITNLGLSLFFVVICGLAWQGRIQAQIVAVLGFALIGIYILHRNDWLKFSLNAAYLKNALYFGLPLIPHTLGAVIITMTDRFFITNMVGLEATGLYSVGYAFGSIIGMLEHSFNQAYVPWLYERLKRNEIAVKIKIVKATYLYFIIITFFAISLSLIAPWFLSFFVGQKFAGSHVFVFWIALGYAFSGMYKMVGNYIFYAQKTYILAWVTFFSALLNIVLNYFLIKYNGAVGAAQASTITHFVFFILTWLFSSKVYNMPWLLNLKSKI